MHPRQLCKSLKRESDQGGLQLFALPKRCNVVGWHVEPSESEASLHIWTHRTYSHTHVLNNATIPCISGLNMLITKHGQSKRSWRTHWTNRRGMWDMIVITNSSTSSPIISPDTIIGAFAADKINLQYRHYAWEKSMSLPCPSTKKKSYTYCFFTFWSVIPHWKLIIPSKFQSSI